MSRVHVRLEVVASVPVIAVRRNGVDGDNSTAVLVPISMTLPLGRRRPEPEDTANRQGTRQDEDPKGRSHVVFLRG